LLNLLDETSLADEVRERMRADIARDFEPG
jgi:hypothetical protein